MKTFAEAEDKVNSFVVPLDRSSSYSLKRIKQILNQLDNPQEKLKAVHIAGTSGKTSTSYYTANILNKAGYKVGLSVSPYVEAMNERVQIGTKPLEEELFCEELTTFMKILNTLSVRPTYFELFVAFAYWYFVKIRVDYAVVEVGLGGLLDATNVIRRDDKICMITDIGLDHTQILGGTLTEIARQKAGIIQFHNHVFMYEQGNPVQKEVLDKCREKHAVLHIIKPQNLKTNIPDFQKRNWLLARNVCEHIFEQSNRNMPAENWWLATTKIVIPGRLEALEYKGKTLILDGAHNSQKMLTLINSFKKKFPKLRPAVLFAASASRDEQISDISNLIKSLANYTIITSLDGRQKDVSGLAENFDPDKSITEADSDEALKILLGRDEELLLITGSLYLVGKIRKILRNESNFKNNPKPE